MIWARGGGGTSPAALFRGGAAGNSPDLAKSGRPGVKSTRARVWVFSAALRTRLGTKLGSGKSGAVLAAAAAGWRGEASPARAFRPCLCQTAGAKGKAGRCGAHLDSNRAVKACRVDGVGDERRRTGGGSGRWRRRGPRDSWIPTGSFRFGLRNKGRSQRDPRKTGGAESTGRSLSPVAGALFWARRRR